VTVASLRGTYDRGAVRHQHVGTNLTRPRRVLPDAEEAPEVDDGQAKLPMQQRWVAGAAERFTKQYLTLPSLCFMIGIPHWGGTVRTLQRLSSTALSDSMRRGLEAALRFHPVTMIGPSI
jgi:hypothetical protein